MKPRVLLQIPRSRYEQIFDAEARGRLSDLAELFGPFDEAGARTLSPRLSEADAVFMPSGTRLSAEALDAAPRLRWISTTSGGPPSVDYRVAFRRRIVVSDCRRAFGRAVAEMALGLYLAAMRDIVAHDRALHTPDGWEAVPKERNREASHRTLGFVGFGSNARTLVPFLAPFEPRMLAYDPFVPEEVLTRFGARPASLTEVFASSDAVFLLATPNPGNRALIGAAELDRLRPEAVLLVVSRSSLVDEAALIDRLKAGKFRAAMDVYDQEPLPAGHPYRSLPNVVLTPHRAGGTQESYWRIGRALIDDLELLLAGEPLRHTTLVDEATARRLGLLAESAEPDREAARGR
jgi:phosphoglycerate dehydrogenase-like enzyme